MRAPPPAAELEPDIYLWPRGDEVVRCHNGSYGATEFNPHPKISQRFRPFTARRRTVPTLYGAESIEGALSETLFHAVPVDGPDRTVGLSKLVAWQISRLTPIRDLRLADLRDESLPKLDLSRAELIESPATSYPQTAKWASAFFHCPQEPDGLVWNSRQAKEELSLVLFSRGRVARTDLGIAKSPVPMAVGQGAAMVYAAGEKLKITIAS